MCCHKVYTKCLDGFADKNVVVILPILEVDVCPSPRRIIPKLVKMY